MSRAKLLRGPRQVGTLDLRTAKRVGVRVRRQGSQVTVPKLTESDQDHLRAVYNAGGAERRVSMGELAQQVRHSPAAVTAAAKRLHALGLVDYERYRGVRLTASGEHLALELVRHHRLLETFLVEFLGYDWDSVDEEADRLEHAISEELERRIAARVSDPTTDPHGDHIPSEALEAVPDTARPLTSVPPGRSVVVSRVLDRDREILSYLGGIGLVPGVLVEVIDRLPFDGPLVVKVNDSLQHLGRPVSDSVFVSDASQTDLA